MVNRLLPELIDVSLAEIRRLEIDRGGGPSDKAKGALIVVRGREGWQMISPVDTAADDSLLETLARNLKDIRRSSDAGTITEDPKQFGLEPPEATIRVYIRDHMKPEATLEVGKGIGERLYVREKGTKGIEVVDARLFSPLRLPTADWRDKALFHMPSFRVASLTVHDTRPGRDFKVERDERRWKLVSPVKAPADDDKVEGLVAELSALRIIDGPDAFVADDVKDLAPYGLDKPETTIEIAPFGVTANEPTLGPQKLLFGKSVPGHPDQVYAKRGSQDDVIRVNTKILRESLPGPTGLRSQKVFTLSPSRAFRIRIETAGKMYDVVTRGVGWHLLSPIETTADTAAVQELLTRLSELRSSEFLEPSTVTNAQLDPAQTRIRVWQIEPGSRTSPEAMGAADLPKDEPTIDLALGRRDALKKTVYGRLPSDSVVLALPDSLLSVLPKNDFAFRDRSVLRLQPAKVARLSVLHNRRLVTVVAPGSGSKSLNWSMAVPDGGRPDVTSVTGLLMALSTLTAESWESDQAGDGRAWGLDAPWLTISWLAPDESTAKTKSEGNAESRSLKIGKTLPKSDSYYATLDGDPRVFSLSAAVVSALQIELRDRTLLSFPPARVAGVTFRWPERTLALERLPTPDGTPPAWQASPGYDPSGFDVSHFNTTIAALNDLKATRFLRDDGPFPASAGLSPQRVTIEIQVADENTPRVLRIGNDFDKDQVHATFAPGSEGPIVALPVSRELLGLLREPSRTGDMPSEPFVPDAKPTSPPG